MENAAEETFRNQDITNIGRYAPNTNVIYSLFSLRASCRPFPSPSGEPPKHFRGVLSGSPLKTTPRRKPRRRSLPSKGDGNGTAFIKKKP